MSVTAWLLLLVGHARLRFNGIRPLSAVARWKPLSLMLASWRALAMPARSAWDASRLKRLMCWNNTAGHGSAKHGWDRHGAAWRGRARHGRAWLGEAGQRIGKFQKKH